MKPKRLWKIGLTVPQEFDEAAAEILTNELETPTSTYRKPESTRSEVAVYVETRPIGSEVRARLKPVLRKLFPSQSAGRWRISIIPIPPENWALSWRGHFKPLNVGSALLVKPGWSRRKPKAGQHSIVIDPGLSFGTGQHPTTQFCLEMLVSARDGSQRPSQPFLDLGTGSGILAIAAARLGFSPVVAIDFDPDAICTAKINAQTNGLLNKISFSVQDLTCLPARTTKKYPVICANLIADLLIREHKRITARMAPNGRLILAGILNREFSSVNHIYAKAGLKLISSQRKGEWKSGMWIRQ